MTPEEALFEEIYNTIKDERFVKLMKDLDAKETKMQIGFLELENPMYSNLYHLSLKHTTEAIIDKYFSKTSPLPVNDTAGIHIKGNDAFKNEAGEDTGSELALWHKDGGLLATIFLNDITAKAYGMDCYSFSFNAEGVRQIREYLNQI